MQHQEECLSWAWLSSLRAEKSVLLVITDSELGPYDCIAGGVCIRGVNTVAGCGDVHTFWVRLAVHKPLLILGVIVSSTWCLIHIIFFLCVFQTVESVDFYFHFLLYQRRDRCPRRRTCTEECWKHMETVNTFLIATEMKSIIKLFVFNIWLFASKLKAMKMPQSYLFIFYTGYCLLNQMFTIFTILAYVCCNNFTIWTFFLIDSYVK